jgi:O-antigen ligase
LAVVALLFARLLMRLFGRPRDQGRDARLEPTAAPEPAPAPQVEKPPIPVVEQPLDLEQRAEAVERRRRLSLSGSRRALPASVAIAGVLQPGRGLRSRPSLVLVFASLTAVVAAGAAASSLTPRTALIIVLLVACALVFAFCRNVMRRKSEPAVVESIAPAPLGASGAARVPQPPDMRAARRLYYLGLVLMALLTVRISYTVTFSDVFFLFSVMLAAAELVLVRRNVPIRIPLLLLGGMAIFTIGGLLSSLDSYSALKSIAVVVRLIFLTVFWFWLGTLVLSRQSHVRKAIVLWVTSAAICGSGAVLQFMAGDIIPNTHMIFGRATGFTGHPNDLGGVTAIAFVPALMLSAREGLAVPARLFSYLLFLLVTAGLVLSGSVGAMIAAVVGVFVWFALQRTSGRSLAVLAVIVGAAVAITAVQSVRGAQTPLDRFHSVTAKSSGPSGAGSLESRISTYRVVSKAIKDDPFIGVGLDLVSVTKPFGIISYEYDVHNLVIGTWYKAGLLGLIGMLLALYAVLRVGWTAMLAARSDSERMLVAALLSAVAAFVVFAMGAPVLFSRYGWIAAALLVALRAVQVGDGEPRPSLREGASASRTGVYDSGPVRPSTGFNPA